MSINSIFFVDSLYGWAGGGTIDNAGIILRTTDGGTNWIISEQDTQSAFQGVWFIDRQTGWVVGGRENYAVIDTTCQKILKTTDGGLTWQRQWNRNANTNWRNLYGVCFVGNTGWACVCGWADSLGYIIKTTDGGANWSNQVALRSSSDPMDIQFLDASHGVCCGGWNWGFPYDNTDGIISSTSDGGTTWSTPYTWRPGSLAMGYFEKIWMVDALNGWCAGGAGGPNVSEPGRVVRTTNGGSSWIVRNPSPLRPFSSVYFPEASWGWVGAYDGSIILTTDGGSTWLDDNSGVTSSIYDIHGLNRTNAWAGCANGSILRYIPPTGVDDQSQIKTSPSQPKPRVIPNPFVSFASVLGHERESFVLYDISGRQMGTFRGDRVGEGVSPGIYFVKSTAQGSEPVRIVKIR
jgi:photosystem II stability/assembly factor-like uncharacterized protein